MRPDALASPPTDVAKLAASAPVSRRLSAWEESTTKRTNTESPWDDAMAAATTNPTSRGFAHPDAPLAVPAPRTPTPARGHTVPSRRARPRPPTEPEIETYLEMEADLPPESGGDPDLESELALSIALSGDLDNEHQSMSITIEDDSRRVIETVTEDSSQTLTLTVTEPSAGDHGVRQRAITAEDGAAVSGTISIPEDTPSPPPRRMKRRSDNGHD